MLTLYFSGTGNTRFLAETFSKKLQAECYSIEEKDTDFDAIIAAHDVLAFCYPIYCSRVPRIMREFSKIHMERIVGKKIIVLVTQMLFSGDGARVFVDLFPKNTVEVIYAEHFNMQQNMGNTPVLNLLNPTDKFFGRVEKKLDKVCKDIKNGVIKRRGFAKISVLLGCIQGKPWQKDTSIIHATDLEKIVKDRIKIHKECTSCNRCMKVCPMNNLTNHEGTIVHKNNCTVCYRCVNICPQKAITVFFHKKPRWQYIAK
ncbi:MAG: EFR1 family ferrodoxin [Defluviitaleaceae bacterium]|nr:EFR1 family ferrodoxin [Defluviitaleaceae bacterium]